MCPGLYRRLRPVAASVATRPSDIDDLIQEAAVALWADGHTRWDARTVVIARRRMIDWQRTQYGRFGSYKRSAGAPSELHPWAHPGTVDVDLERVPERVDAQRVRWDRLTLKQRLAVELRASGLTLAEVGRRLGITESAVCFTMKRAARRLQLEDDHESVREQADRRHLAGGFHRVVDERRDDDGSAVGAA